MHIPDGYLGPKTVAATFALVAPFWFVAWRRVQSRIRGSEIPYLALSAAFVFVVQMFNVPILFGTTGHAVGASIVAIALGAWPAMLAVTFALTLQAVVFGDGGVLAIGANSLNMAVIQVFVSLAVWNLLRPRDPSASRGRTFYAAFAAGYVGVVAAALATAFMFGIQPALERGPGGSPLYAQIPLAPALYAMGLSHLLIGLLEGAITGAVAVALAPGARSVPELGANLLPAGPVWHRRGFWALAVVIVLAVPLGLWLPEKFGAGAAWGEWSPEEAAQRAGLETVPAGMAKTAGIWKAPVPDYAFREPGGKASESVQYILAALLGVALISVTFLLLGKWQRSRLEKIREL